VSERAREKFRPQNAFIWKTKEKAQASAVRLRKQGFRAIVQPTAKITQKRSPEAKWVTFMGQRRRR
jgi:uroporphyrinogen-III synthase